MAPDFCEFVPSYCRGDEVRRSAKLSSDKVPVDKLPNAEDINWNLSSPGLNSPIVSPAISPLITFEDTRPPSAGSINLKISILPPPPPPYYINAAASGNRISSVIASDHIIPCTAQKDVISLVSCDKIYPVTATN